MAPQSVVCGYQFYSDRSLKRDVKPIAAPLDIVQKLEGVSYALLAHPFDDGERERTAEDVFRDKNQLGFIAQEVEKILPQLVQIEPDTGLKTVG